jgi:alkylation response protein AidB-like acyl-CoA dehydrogenase
VPADQLVGAENMGWTYAKFLLGNERTGITGVGRTKVKLAVAKEYAAQTKIGSGTLLEDPVFGARVAELENELLALELTLLRVVANSAEGKPNPVSSVLKLRGSELQQAATELLLDIAGPDSLPVNAEAIASPDWAQRSGPGYLNFRKTTIYGGSSEVQRTIIASTILGL